MSIEGQGHSFTIYFPGFVCFVLYLDKISGERLQHTCDTFLNQNREIWNFWSGNLCLVSGGFHVANFGPFLPKLKSRNLVTFLEICYRASQSTYANRSENMRPFTV